ncbi:hypothetical protein O9X98_10525 [Agrobacterium salinitolerans]|nr:hypothetical protein [Agrobacterium salinitolerans]
MRAKYSPTVVDRDFDRLWWAKNGGGYGLLEDGSQMTDAYYQFDHEGFDRFGYDERGVDRAGHTVRDYEIEELYNEILTRGLPPRYSKPVSQYWHAATAIADNMSERFSELPVVNPQDPTPSAPHIAIHVGKNGGYGVRLVLEDMDGSPRSLEVAFDADGNSLTDTWSVNVTARSGGETRRTGRQSVVARSEALDFARSTVAAYDPDRRLYDVLVVESGDGMIYLDAHHRSERARGDILGTVYASDAASAIEALARRFQPGGTVQRMASRGLRRLGAELPSIEARVSNSAAEAPRSGSELPAPWNAPPGLCGPRPY